MKPSEPLSNIVHELIASAEKTPRFLNVLKRAFSKRNGVPIPQNRMIRAAHEALIKSGELERTAEMDELLTVSHIRSQSGVAIITLLTMPYPCPGKCVFCPDEVRMPKSYVASEPAAARALMLNFDPYLQTARRIQALEENGHPADKIELIFKGGTWSSYPIAYQQWFIQQCFQAMNEYGIVHRNFSPDPESPYSRFIGTEKESWSIDKLFDDQKKNETANYRCIGLTIETRPDFVSSQEIKRLRMLGCTRVELGLQTTEDAVHELTQRGHDSQAVARATKMLKDAGFKVDHHLMPGLPGATPESDLQTARDVFETPHYQPDTVKLYPCVVTPNTVLEQWWKDGTYTPYTAEQIVSLLSKIKSIVPPYVRIARVIRDFPSTEITAGNMVTNLREEILKYMSANDMRCHCLRCREVGHESLFKGIAPDKLPVLCEHTYDASGGKEVFLSFEDEKKEVLYAFLRLRIPSTDNAKVLGVLPELADCALIRELHTYGHLVPISAQEKDASQHKGYGKRLLERAEQLAREAGYAKIAVISGIGVREYYKKLGYALEGTYMVKYLD